MNIDEATMGSLGNRANRTRVGLCTMALLSSVASSQTGGVPSSDSSHPLGDPASDGVVHLQKFEVTGHPTMGVKAGIACDHLLLGKVVHVIVNEVTKGGRGWKLGIRVGDEILAINGDPLIGK
ncbi:MAG: PDZ domain-containing protein, partial [Opitutaceae bacterium]